MGHVSVQDDDREHDTREPTRAEPSQEQAHARWFSTADHRHVYGRHPHQGQAQDGIQDGLPRELHEDLADHRAAEQEQTALQVIPEFEEQDVDRVWRAHNSTVEAVREGDGLIWCWRIEAGREAFLWVSEDVPFHDDMNRYDRLAYDMFLDVVYVKGILDITFARRADWHHVEHEADEPRPMRAGSLEPEPAT